MSNKIATWESALGSGFAIDGPVIDGRTRKYSVYHGPDLDEVAKILIAGKHRSVYVPGDSKPARKVVKTFRERYHFRVEEGL